MQICTSTEEIFVAIPLESRVNSRLWWMTKLVGIGFVAIPLESRVNSRDPLATVENQHIQLPNSHYFVQILIIYAKKANLSNLKSQKCLNYEVIIFQ